MLPLSKGTLAVIQGTLDVIQGTFIVIQGTLPTSIKDSKRFTERFP
jgi:hypothetical protein